MNISTLNFTTPETSTNSSTPSRLLDYPEICVYSICLLFGLPTHFYVLWVIVTGKGIAVEFFSLNLSVCELGICLNSLVFVLSEWIESLSKLDLFLIGLSFTGRPLFQCVICVERYLAVVHPVIFLKSKPLRYRLICCVVVWIITLVSCFIVMYYLVSQYRYMYICFTCVQVILVLFIQMFCLVSVLRALKQSGPGDRKREEENHMKRRAFIIILITTVNTVIMYGPLMITSFYQIVTGDIVFTKSFASLVCFMLTGFVYPLLYLHRAGKLSCKLALRT